MMKTFLVFGLQKGYLENDKPGNDYIQSSLVPKIRKFLRENRDEQIYFCNFRNEKESSFQEFLNWGGMMKEEEIENIEEMTEFLTEDNVFHYTTESALSSERLEEELVYVEKMYLIGVDTDASILATTFDAFGKGIEPIVLEDLVYSRAGKENHESALTILNRIIGEERVINSDKL